MHRGKLAASTLVETIVAMVIILIISGIGLSIFLSATKSNNRIQEIKAIGLVDYYLSDSHIYVGPKTIEQIHEELKAEISIDYYKGNNKVLLVSVSIFNKDGIRMIQAKRLITSKK